MSLSESKSYKPPDAEQIERLIAVLAKLERTIDEGLGAFLAAKFPFGKWPADRWRRSA